MMTTAERNDEFNKGMAIADAKRRAARMGEEMRVYRAYNAYCIRPRSSPYEGVSVGFVSAEGVWRLATGTE